MSHSEPTYDVMVIGAGFAGMAAALFAANRGLSVAQVGATGGIDFSTGFIDLMGVHPMAEGTRWMNPWKAIKAVLRDIPGHPYGLLSESEIRESLNEFSRFLADQGLEYVGAEDSNTRVLTSAGTVKRTYMIPRSAWAGSTALKTKASTVIVDFHGLKGFSGNQLVENRKHDWQALRTIRVDFPGGSGELYPEHMAWALADPAKREKLAEAVAPHVTDAEYIGFPAVLGLNDPLSVITHLESLTGKTVFEIPTMPPSIAGPRLRAAFDRGLPPLGVRTLSQKMVTETSTTDDGTLRFRIGKGAASSTVSARSAILATGRFFGKGLKADRRRVVEPLYDLPVVQPNSREAWHADHFFDPNGHAVNMAGVQIDTKIRALGSSGEPVHERLHVAGAILAHHDWMRMKCGAGLAIATAFKAVKELTG